jgi:hypothetical protein
MKTRKSEDERMGKILDKLTKEDIEAMRVNKHTSTPWKISELKTSINGTDFDGEQIRILDIPDHEAESQQADAEFVVRAVNCHDELVHLLKEQLDCWEKGIIVDIKPGSNFHLNVRAAIAKAEGK